MVRNETSAMKSGINGKLNVNWDVYWRGFMSFPIVEFVRFRLIKRGCERLLKSFSSDDNPSFCELGAGAGAVSRYLGERYKAAITIVDSNPKALQISKKTFENFPYQFSLIKKDVFDLNESVGKFDLVYSGGLIEHFVGADRDLIVKVHCDLVKDNGYLLILVPVFNMWYRILNEGVFKYLHFLDEIPEVPWSLFELSNSLEKNGFGIISTTTVISELGVLAKKLSRPDR